MSNDLSIRGLRRTPDTAGSNTQAADDKILDDPAVNSQQGEATPNLRNQNAQVANARKAEAGMMPNRLQSQLLNQTNKTISTGANRTNLPPAASDGAALQKALNLYGITDKQLQHYVVTGEEPEGLKKAINDAKNKGEWPALNIVRASFQKRAEYLRANSGPNDKEIRAHADQLDAASADLIRNHLEIQLQQAKDKLRALTRAYPDSAPPAKIQQQIAQAMKDIEDINSEIGIKLQKK